MDFAVKKLSGVSDLFKKYFQEHYQCQAVWIQIRSDLGPNCLQKLFYFQEM